MKTEAVNGASERVHDAIYEAKDSLQEAGKLAAKSASRVIGELADVGKEKVETYTEQGKEQFAKVQTYVHDYPLRSVLIGALAGFFLSRLIRH